MMKKNLPGMTLAFVLSISGCIFLLTIGLLLGALRPERLSESIRKSGYYKTMATDTTKELEIYIKEQGLGVSMLEDVTDRDQMILDATSYVTAQLDGQSGSIDTSEMETELTQNILSYMKEEGIDDNQQITRGVQEISTKVGSIYRSGMELPLASYYHTYQSSLITGVRIAAIASGIISLILIFVLLKFQTHSYRGMRWIAGSAFAASVLNMIISLQLGNALQITESGTYFEIWNSFVKGSMNSMYLMTGVGAVLFVAACFMTKVLKNRE